MCFTVKLNELTWNGCSVFFWYCIFIHWIIKNCVIIPTDIQLEQLYAGMERKSFTVDIHSLPIFPINLNLSPTVYRYILRRPIVDLSCGNCHNTCWTWGRSCSQILRWNDTASLYKGLESFESSWLCNKQSGDCLISVTIYLSVFLYRKFIIVDMQDF